MHKLQLTTNMRAALDPAFSDFLLKVREGVEPFDEHDQIFLAPHLVIPCYNKEESLDKLKSYIVL